MSGAPTQEEQEEELLAAAERGDAVRCTQLVRLGVNPDCSSPSRYGHTPLSLAAVGGHVEVAELLLEDGEADPDVPANGGFTALHRACAWSREEVMMLLIEFSCDVEARDCMHES